MSTNYENKLGKYIFYTGLLASIITLVLAFNSQRPTLAQEEDWSQAIPLSEPPGFSWFPDLTVDESGSIHVVWCWTIPEDTGGLREQVHYSRWDGQDWSQPNDIVPPSADIVRNAVAADLGGNIHLLFGGSVYDRNFGLYYQKAPKEQAWSAGAWSSPHLINQGISYMGDLAVDSQGAIHVIYDDIIHSNNDLPTRADIFYRRSTNGGQTWTRPVDLSQSPSTGSARPSLEIDANDTLHITWDEGWDRLSGTTVLTYHSGYLSSFDGGNTWTPPTIVDHPDESVVQLAAGSNAQGGVMLVWRSNVHDNLFYQWSTDSGLSWTPAYTIPHLISRPWSNPFDMYDMTTDSGGNIHLLVVGRVSPEDDATLGVYHLSWDGNHWSAPARVFASAELYPEYPKIFISEGNQLHAAWFTREHLWDQTAQRTIWYSKAQASTPHQVVTPLPTPTAQQTPTAIQGLAPTATPHPTLAFHNTDLPGGLYTDHDDWMRLIITLSPLVLVLASIILFITLWSGKLRR